MNRMMPNIQRFGRIRKLIHTITSQETIKPSSPTPPHLKTRYLSFLDHFAPNVHLPILFFYKNYNNNVTNLLKKSLSQSLAAYYPLAGRFPTPYASYIDCNDAGVEFLEASNNSRLNDFIINKEQDEMIDALIPNALGCVGNKTSPKMAAVQLNHFACGGAAIAVSISHKVADGFTIGSFLNHWATLTRGGSPTNPTFINLSSSISDNRIPEFTLNKNITNVSFTTRRFVFPDSKLNELKNMINNMSTIPLNPSRVEALTALLFKCSVNAATTKSGYLQPSKLTQALNMRKHITNFPDLVAGNIFVAVTKNMADLDPVEVISEFRKEFTEFRGLRDLEQVEEKHASKVLRLGDDQSVNYTFTSLCRFPFYEMDFGWGKPEQVMAHVARGDGNICILMDTWFGDGIEVTMQLEEDEMTIFQEDKQLLAFVQDI